MIKKKFFVEWYRQNGRDFPWRKKDVSSFSLLINEMLLRQTQAVSVSKIWHSFIPQFPDAQSLMKASQDALSEQIKVLGFGNQRAAALISAGTYISEKYDGKVPSSFDKLLDIPHVGEYTAKAILCFAFGQKQEIVDANVLRFYSRYYGIEVKPDIRRNPEIWKIASDALPRKRLEVKEHNYGLLDFTAAICRAKNPQCNTNCPLMKNCRLRNI